MIPFVKMHGIGNDFVLLDGIRNSFTGVDFGALSAKMCDRRRGVGADGLLLAERDGDGFRMRMWNPDGSESEMCGNGIRCFAKYLVDEGHTQARKMRVATGAGILEPAVQEDGLVRVDMGPARTSRQDIGIWGPPDASFIEQPIDFKGTQMKGTAVSMGNPHLVLFVPDVDAVPLTEWGPALETHPLFPKRINVHFVQVLSRDHLRQRTWERGAGVTLACGTGACASAVAGRVTGRTEDRTRVSLPGGDLLIECHEGENVFMTGPAETVFVGEWRS